MMDYDIKRINRIWAKAIKANPARHKKLVASFAPLNEEIPIPDALTPEGEALRDEIVEEVVKALVGFKQGRRWPLGD